MPRVSPYAIVLTADEQQRLAGVARKYTSPYCQVVRAKAILLAAEGLDNMEIGHRLDVPRQIVSKWRKRFFAQRLDGLTDASRRGRPSVFPPGGGDTNQSVGL